MYKRFGVALALTITLLLGISVPAYAQTEESETKSTETSEQGEDAEEVSLEGNAFTEDGNAALGDTATSADNKEFITVTTKKGNTFYLVIDRQRDSDNVYFLNMVDESDLEAFLDENSGSGLDTIVSLPEETEVKEEPAVDTIEETKETESTDVLADGFAAAKENGNMNYLIIIVAVGVFGAAYYFKIYKKKKQSFDEYESEDEYEEGYEDEEYEEDDQPDTDEEYEEEEGESAAEREARLEEERQAKLEEERVRKEQLRKKQEQLKEEESQLEEEQEQLLEAQRALEQRQNQIKEKQQEIEDGKDGIF